MTASVDALGELHNLLAQVYAQILQGREEPILKDGEPVLDADGQPLMRRIMPSAAELAAINTFLKTNNITAVAGNEGALNKLQTLLDERRKSKAGGIKPAPFTLPDPLEAMPKEPTWQ